MAEGGQLLGGELDRFGLGRAVLIACVLGEEGISIGASYQGETQETFLALGTRSILEKTANTIGLRPAEIDEEATQPLSVRKTEEIFTRDLLEKILTRTIPLFREAWRQRSHLKLQITLAVPAPLQAQVETTLSVALERYSLQPLESEVVTFQQLL